ncbi:MAG: YqaJ viral recombinase family protein [Betaproteobacteria bacterium]
MNQITHARPHGIGGTDISAILGFSPYRTPVQLWAEKVGLSNPETTEEIHLRFGQHLEPFVATEYERVTGLHTIAPDGPLFHAEHSFMFANVDRLVTTSKSDPAFQVGRVVANRILECKTSSVFGSKGWGEVGTDQVPAHYLLQCAWYLAVANIERADIAVLIGNNDFRVYSIARVHRLEGLLLESAKRFWNVNVKGKVPPAIQTVHDAHLLFASEVPGSQLEASARELELIEKYEHARLKASEIEKETQEIKAELLACMGTAQDLTHNGTVIASWRSIKAVKRLDVRALRVAHPEIAERFSITGQATRRFVLQGTD